MNNKDLAWVLTISYCIWHNLICLLAFTFLHFGQEFVYVTLTSKAEEFEQVGNELSASSESQIRSVLRERGLEIGRVVG